jgi:hypothetical protein
MLPLESDHLEAKEADGRDFLGLMELALGRVQRWALVLPALNFGVLLCGTVLPARLPTFP